MSFFATASRASALSFLPLLLAVGLAQSPAHALDLDWHGQFRAEANTIFGYTNGVSASPNKGYTVPNNGNSPATFQNLFFRLDPRVLVNDNVSLHSDIWFGLPDAGLFGSDAGTGSYFYNDTRTGNASITARTFFAELASDFGTVRVGRIPLNWGLGLIWNSKETNFGFDRLPSNGDGVSLVTKLGAFKFMPAIIKYQNAFYTSTGTNNLGNSGVSDYTLALSYSNDDEQIDLGIMFMRRIAGINSNVVNPFSITTPTVTTTSSPTTSSYAYNVWDFYAQKRAGIFTISAEVPLVSGLVASREYSTVAGALKTEAQFNERWSMLLNVGSAQGQDNGQAGAPPVRLTAFYFHPDYRPGFLMFNYNYQNIATGTGSPFYNPVTNAKFLALGATYNTGKWSHGIQGVYAVADKTANGVAGDLYFNTQSGTYQLQAGGPSQEKGLGTEIDYMIGYEWDESIRFGLDLGLYFPGKFFAFNNSGTPNAQKTIFGSNLNMQVQF